MELKFIISLVIMYIYIFFKSKKSVQMLQQNWYNDDNRYLKWVLKNPKKVFLELDILFLIFILFEFIVVEAKTIMICFVIL